MQTSDEAFAQQYHQETITSSLSDPTQWSCEYSPAGSGRRRSRASKRAPTTVLNADANNFRALVQQFTGCHTRATSSHKGPINLNFSLTNQQNDIFSSTSKVPWGAEGTSIYYDEKPRIQQQRVVEDEEDQKLHQLVQDTVSTSKASVSTVKSDPGPLTLDDFGIDNDVYLQEMLPPPEDYSLPDHGFDDFWRR